jgi:hypothetical protein
MCRSASISCAPSGRRRGDRNEALEILHVAFWEELETPVEEIPKPKPEQMRLIE